MATTIITLTDTDNPDDCLKITVKCDGGTVLVERNAAGDLVPVAPSAEAALQMINFLCTAHEREPSGDEE